MKHIVDCLPHYLLRRWRLTKCRLCRRLCPDVFFNRNGSLLIDALTTRAEMAEAEVKRLTEELKHARA